MKIIENMESAKRKENTNEQAEKKTTCGKPKRKYSNRIHNCAYRRHTIKLTDTGFGSRLNIVFVELGWNMLTRSKAFQYENKLFWQFFQ